MLAGIICLLTPDLGLSIIDAQIITLMSFLTTYWYSFVCIGQPEEILQRIVQGVFKRGNEAHPSLEDLGEGEIGTSQDEVGEDAEKAEGAEQRPPSKKRHKLHLGILGGWTTAATLLIHALMTSAFGMVVYAHVDTFGRAAYRPDCIPNSDFIFDMFGNYISATNGGLQGFALFAFAAVAFTCVEISVIYLVAVVVLWIREARAHRQPAGRRVKDE